MTLNRTLLSLILTVALGSGTILGQEVVTDFTEQGLTTLNEELRKTATGLDNVETWTGTKSSVAVSISGGVISVSQTFVSVDTEADAASDDLNTINGGTEGNLLIVIAENAARTVVLKDGTGNLKLAGDCTLDNSEDTVTLIKTGLNWQELTRSNNGA